MVRFPSTLVVPLLALLLCAAAAPVPDVLPRGGRLPTPPDAVAERGMVDADDAVLREADVAPEPVYRREEWMPWTIGLVVVALVGGGIWLVLRRRKSS